MVILWQSGYSGQSRYPGQSGYQQILLYKINCCGARDQHGFRKNCPVTKFLKPNGKNIPHKNLVDSKKVLLPLLQLNLGPMKQFIKALPINGPCSKCLC